MRKARIKKRVPLKARWKATPVFEKILIFVPVIACAVLIAWALATPKSEPNMARANRELLLSTAGEWSTFEDYGVDVWCPADISEEQPGELGSADQKLFVTRDKGEFPEISYGVLIPQDMDGRSFDIANDISSVMDVVTPAISEAFASMINGVYPTITSDIDMFTLSSGEPVLRGEGEATVTVVYQDPKDSENQWAEETSVNLYYNVIVFHGRPVIIWGTWDYSTYEGRERVVASVTDGIVSLLSTQGGESMEPTDEPPVSTDEGSGAQDEVTENPETPLATESGSSEILDTSEGTPDSDQVN